MEVRPETLYNFENSEMGYLCSSVLKTPQGKALIAKLKELYIYRSPFIAHDPSFGTMAEFLFFRQGHADLIRFIEQQARAYEEPKNV